MGTRTEQKAVMAAVEVSTEHDLELVASLSVTERPGLSGRQPCTEAWHFQQHGGQGKQGKELPDKRGSPRNCGLGYGVPGKDLRMQCTGVAMN